MDKIFSIKNSFIFIIIATIFLFLKDDGIIDYQTLVTQHNQLLIEMNDLSNQLYDLKKENLLLQNNNNYIEKIAREQYFYIFPNETIIHF